MGEILVPFSILIAILGISIVIDFIGKYAMYLKNKGTKFKYLPCIIKSKNYYYLIIISLFYIVMIIVFKFGDIIKYGIKADELAHGLNTLSYCILSLIILIIGLLIMRIIWQILCGNVVLVNDRFIGFCNGRIKFDEVEYVEMLAIKGRLKLREVRIFVNGFNHISFFIKDKYTTKVINIFQDKNACIKIKD